MRRSFLSALVGASFAVAGLAYCGGVPSSSAGSPDAGATSCDCAAPVYKSGSRLKARKLTSVDGASQFVGWFDTQFGAACEYSTRDAFTGVCLPTVASRSYFQDDTRPYFTDAACTIAAVAVVKSDRDHGQVPVLCEAGGHIRRSGEAVPQIYQPDAHGACLTPHDAATDQAGVIFLRCDDPALSSGDFVAFTESVE